MIDRGWADADRLFDGDRDWIEELRCLITIPELAEAMGIQIHARGLTCPSPDHYQSGHSAPAWTYWGSSDGIERWKCGGCGLGGDLFDYVIYAGEAEDFAAAADVVADVIEGMPLSSTRQQGIPRNRERHPEDPDRLRPVRSPEGIKECAQYCADRGWGEWDYKRQRLSFDPLPASRWAFLRDDSGFWLRVYADDERSWWQDRALSGQCRPDGEAWRWRSPYDRDTCLFVWEPDYIERRTWVERSSIYGNFRRSKEIDHTPVVPPLTLVVEGASDFVTAVTAQRCLALGERFSVLGLPGAGMSDRLEIRDDWAVLLDNDEAGERARERLDAEQPTVRHLWVSAEYNDLSEWWRALGSDMGPPPPWERRRSWITELREALTPDNETEEDSS